MENTITLIAKLSLLASILSRWTNADHGMCHTVRSVSDRALVGHVYKTLQEKQIATCVAACEMEKNCYSINFQLSTKTCELSRRNAKWYPGDVQLRADSVHLSMVLREYDPCVERTSPCAGTCISFPGSLATQCICNAGQNQSCQNNCEYLPCSFILFFLRIENEMQLYVSRNNEKTWLNGIASRGKSTQVFFISFGHPLAWTCVVLRFRLARAFHCFSKYAAK